MAKLDLPDLLVSADWLNQNLGHENLVIFDASWHMPASGRDGLTEWQQQRIPGARFFDFDGKICDAGTELPHMMPTAEIFTRELQALGLNQDSRVIVYDSVGMFSSPRGWWMLRAMSFENCAVLDGGLVAWIEAGFSIERGSPLPEYPGGDFVARANPKVSADTRSLLAALDDERVCVLDARPKPRFDGTQNEPRPGLRLGHMPGAKNLPFPMLFNRGLLKSKDELSQLFAPLVDACERSICSCGSGVTACILAFAANYIGYHDVAVYDGSWCEWGQPGPLPVVSS